MIFKRSFNFIRFILINFFFINAQYKNRQYEMLDITVVSAILAMPNLSAKIIFPKILMNNDNKLLYKGMRVFKNANDMVDKIFDTMLGNNK